MSTTTTRDFPLGRLRITRMALETLSTAGFRLSELVARHTRCDRGGISTVDRIVNEDALEGADETGLGRIISVYACGAAAVAIVTDLAEARTTIMHADEMTARDAGMAAIAARCTSG
ncbi:MAG TPA: hypothetical protein VEL07_02025 [Planctomycetota bacterium]|nr:hypothetical protein [Planctomycetota bacterium]